MDWFILRYEILGELIIFEHMFSVICNGNNDSKIDGDSSGIWYAGIVVFGKEYAFSQAGVESTLPVSIRLLSD